MRLRPSTMLRPGPSTTLRAGRSVRPGLKALLAHRVRAALAVSSVTAGVAAIVLTSAIGTGAEAEIRRQIENIGANLLVVRPAQVKRFVARKDVKGTVTTLRLDDFDAIAALDPVAEAVPGIEAPVKVKAGASAMTTKVLGTAPEFPDVRRFQIEGGRFFDADDNRLARRVAVLGARVADALFDGNPVGQPIRIRGIPFDVIGVLAPKGAVAGGDEDNQVVVPIRTALRRLFNATWLNTIFVSVNDSRGMADAERQISTLLRERHRVEPEEQADFEVQNATTFLALQQETAETLRRLTTGVAAVAVIVGGMGILALMLMSVRERTGEIGLRMAVGAQPRDILVQFLFEATLLALGGWTVGLVLGGAGATVVALSTSWKIGVPWEALFVSLGMALTIGLGFGALPARRASLIPPIQALRTE
jgi:putative ABC transport system permease protein